MDKSNSQTMSLTYCVLLALISISTVQGKPPNILFILADDYGWNDVGYHADRSLIKTPNIDALAGQGVKLESYYVQCVCTPSRVQFLSGRYQIHTGLQHMIIWAAQKNALPKEDLTIADKLREVGYRNHFVGKWHAGFYKDEYMPMQRGFDSAFGYLASREDYFTRYRCYKSMCGYDFHKDNEVYNSSGQYSTHMYAERVEEIVKQHAAEYPDKPLFIYLPLQAVHEPIQAPQSYIDKYSFIKDKGRRTYAGMVDAMDEAVKNVTDAFKKYGLWDNTVVGFSTDNGGNPRTSGNNWPLRGGKGTLFEGGLRGVGWISGPVVPSAARGTTYRGLMHVSDWMPTFVKLAGGSTEGMGLDGVDMWSAISKSEPSPRKEILHNIDPVWAERGKPRPGSNFNTSTRSAIRVGKWKLITGDPCGSWASGWIPPPESLQDQEHHTAEAPDKDRNFWLFDIENDPLEELDVSDVYPSVLESLLDRLAYYNSTAVTCRFPPDDPEADPAKHDGWWVPWVKDEVPQITDQ